MNIRSRLIVTFMLALLVGPFLSEGAAAAGSGDSRGMAAGARPRAALDRAFESAMLHMDHNLTALLGARTMDCDADGGMETCWVSLDLANPVESPHSPAQN